MQYPPLLPFPITEHDGVGDYSCHEPETQWHVMGMGNLQHIPIDKGTICQDPGGHDEQSRLEHSSSNHRQPMNLTTKVCPGLGRPQLCFKHREFKIVELFENHIGIQNGHEIMDLTESGGMLE
jgi:hypothetical protein